jgi:hypothetical protein
MDHFKRTDVVGDCNFQALLVKSTKQSQNWDASLRGAGFQRRLDRSELLNPSDLEGENHATPHRYGDSRAADDPYTA